MLCVAPPPAVLLIAAGGFHILDNDLEIGQNISMGKPRDIADDIRRLYEEGKTYDEIKEELGCSKSTISYHVGKGNENTRVKSNGYRKRIKTSIQQYKESTPCADCGRTFKYYIMQFDHLPQFVKSFQLSKFYEHTHDIKAVVAEMKKCDLVCANCHSERTHQRRQQRTEHRQQVKDLLENAVD